MCENRLNFKKKKKLKTDTKCVKEVFYIIIIACDYFTNSIFKNIYIMFLSMKKICPLKFLLGILVK